MAYSLKLAEAYVAARRMAEAREVLETAAQSLGQRGRDVEAENVLCLAGLLRQTGQSEAGARSIQRGLAVYPTHEGLWAAWADAALCREQWALALERAQAGLSRLGASPALHLRAAQAYFGLGQVLGAVEVREVGGGRPGQFVEGWLLIERRGPRRFSCCPPASALNELRRALDAGLDVPAAHLLHARIWQRAGKPQVGLALLKSREAVLLEAGDAAALATFAELALEADALNDHLRYSRMLAARQPQRRREILGAAYLAVADRYGQRGESAPYREFSYRALRLRPDDVELTLQVAEAEWHAGRAAPALRLYRRVLQLEPDHPRRRHILQRLATQPARPNRGP